MPLNINGIFSTLHAKSLALGSQRIELLAANIANADTPNYLARDIDFKGAMAAEGSKSSERWPRHRRRTYRRRPGWAAVRPAVLYRIPDQPAQDGNTVDAQKEKAAVAETALRYQTSLTFLNSCVYSGHEASRLPEDDKLMSLMKIFDVSGSAMAAQTVSA